MTYWMNIFNIFPRGGKNILPQHIALLIHILGLCVDAVDLAVFGGDMLEQY